ncbi:DUF1707 and DUF2154 domain-containing protein [Streptomyces sp. F63]|uniref:DUF1707 SHOCT-like domain-containing protein n=1 Tax=Streptomyces sp. F63 TaxID=2824887 RepID=UPI001B383E6A|nr:DUF1707 domain-containing protein [Streptomyces sp. F63]MBQ0983636.1 DUF1707 and DUF2154 domain-containing protein [Streptomyces sp. F63]
MTLQPKDPPLPLSDEDRDAAVRRLQEAYVEGHISHEEMDERLHQALTATTPGDLTPALASLPQGKADTASTVAALTGRIRRRGAWRVPRRLKVESAFGKVHLDLSRAVIEHPVVDIELQLGTGRAKIKVPRDAVVDTEGLQTVWKVSSYKPSRRSRPGGPKIRITGAMGFGRLKIRHARR